MRMPVCQQSVLKVTSSVLSHVRVPTAGTTFLLELL